MKKILSSILFAFLISTPSLAQVSIGISAADYGFYAFGTEKTNPGGAQAQDHSESGAFEESSPSLFVEYDTGVATFGLDIITDTIETPTNKNEQPDGDNTVKGEFKNHLTLYGIFPVSTPFFDGLYVKAGVGMVDLEGITTGITSSYKDTDTTFVTVGFGYQYDTGANGVFVRAEVAAASYDDVSVTSTTASTAGGDKNVVELTDMLSANAKISVGKSF